MKYTLCDDFYGDLFFLKPSSHDSDKLNWVKFNQWRVCMDEERAVMIANAIGHAVLALKFSGERIAEYTLSEKLEEMRQKETNVIGKGVYRDAADLVRTGRLPVA